MIWKEWARFKTTSQRLAEQDRMIIKKDWFSDLEISEIHQQINRESRQQDHNTIIETLNTEKQEHSNRSKTQSNSNQTPHVQTTANKD